MGFSNVLRLKLIVEIRGRMCCVDKCLMLPLLNREFPNYCRGVRHLLLWQAEWVICNHVALFSCPKGSETMLYLFCFQNL